MKFLKKATLAAAVAVAPFAAQAELKAMDDAMMSATTGQAGVNIDVTLADTGISIGSITYTDTDEGVADTTPKGGSIKLNTIGVKGVYADNAANTAAGRVGDDAELIITQTIDVAADGDLVIGMATDTNVNLVATVGDLQLQAASGSTNLNSEVLSNLSVEVSLGANSTTRIHNVDVATETLGTFGITGSKATQTAGLVIENTTDVAIRDLDVDLFGYTSDQGTLLSNTFNTADAASTARANALLDQAQAGGSTVADAAEGTALNSDQREAIADVIAASSAIQVRDVSFTNPNNATGLVTVSQKIWADGDGVNIQMGNIAGDLNVGSIDIGGSTIGSVNISGLNLAGLTSTISGR